MESSYEIRNLENQNRDVGTCQSPFFTTSPQGNNSTLFVPIYTVFTKAFLAEFETEFDDEKYKTRI